MHTSDVVVIGGGSTGCSIAYHMSLLGARVTLLERGDLASGVTGQSPGVVRAYYPDPALTQLALESIRGFRRWTDEISPICSLHETGVLTAVHSAEGDAVRKLIAQAPSGTEIRMLPTHEIARFHADFIPEGLAGAVFEPHAGYCDARAVTHALAMAAARKGADVRSHSSARAILVSHGQVRGVETAEGIIHCGIVVNAAGAWASVLANSCDAPLPIHLEKHQLAEVTVPEPSLLQLPPYLDRTRSFYLRPLGSGGYLIGPAGNSSTNTIPPEAAEVLCNLQSNLPYAQYASRRFTRFERAKLTGGRSAPFDMTPDSLPLAGADPRVRGLYVAAGLSGHGFKFCPVLGRGLADAALGNGRTALLKLFDPERFLQ